MGGRFRTSKLRTKERKVDSWAEAGEVCRPHSYQHTFLLLYCLEHHGTFYHSSLNVSAWWAPYLSFLCLTPCCDNHTIDCRFCFPFTSIGVNRSVKVRRIDKSPVGSPANFVEISLTVTPLPWCCILHAVSEACCCVDQRVVYASCTFCFELVS